MIMKAKNCTKFVNGVYNEKNIRRLKEDGAVECKVYIDSSGKVYFMTLDEPAINRIDPIIDDDYLIF